MKLQLRESLFTAHDGRSTPREMELRVTGKSPFPHEQERAFWFKRMSYFAEDGLLRFARNDTVKTLTHIFHIHPTFPKKAIPGSPMQNFTEKLLGKPGI